MNTADKIPVSVLNRLPDYLHFVKYMSKAEYVSSAAVAKALKLGEVKWRRF